LNLCSESLTVERSQNNRAFRSNPNYLGIYSGNNKTDDLHSSQNNRAFRSNPNGSEYQDITADKGTGHKITEPSAQIPTTEMTEEDFAEIRINKVTK